MFLSGPNGEAWPKITTVTREAVRGSNPGTSRQPGIKCKVQTCLRSGLAALHSWQAWQHVTVQGPFQRCQLPPSPDQESRTLQPGGNRVSTPSPESFLSPPSPGRQTRLCCRRATYYLTRLFPLCMFWVRCGPLSLVGLPPGPKFILRTTNGMSSPAGLNRPPF